MNRYLYVESTGLDFESRLVFGEVFAGVVILCLL